MRDLDDTPHLETLADAQREFRRRRADLEGRVRRQVQREFLFCWLPLAFLFRAVAAEVVASLL